ncbi:hypothetical protein [Acinetobacter silvestris]|uniref:Uncharacterized protein n=1 Tax=Acinetobacter silvestris TaxID=1977882 RepID=A0A1Y3CJA0_9GAMM|nr:hypothetical protein [Acinetobacter silvestris]OTG66678.1 hypothetical protein B9T28_05400 [Acinetobacter silvestris]
MDIQHDTAKVKSPDLAQRKPKSAPLLLCTLLFMSAGYSHADENMNEPGVKKNYIDFGGAIRTRFDFDPDRDIRKFSFDTLILNTDFSYEKLSGSFEYRILGGAYPYDYTDHIGDISFPKKAYVEYAVDDKQAVQFGLNQVPIGFQPYYTSTMLESIAYIAGIEDLYRVGLKYNYKNENSEVLLGYYFANAWKGKGTSNGAYYSNVIVSANDSLENGTQYKEKDALALQYNYSKKFENWTSKYGISGYYSKLDAENNKDEDGHREILGLHYGINNDRVDLKLVTLFNNIKNSSHQTTLGSYDGEFNIANKGMIYSADLNYKLPELNTENIADFNVYTHYSYYDKDQKEFMNSSEWVVGAAFTYKKNFYIASEWLFGKNNPYVGGSDYGQSLASGGSNQWENQLNINIGYYF